MGARGFFFVWVLLIIAFQSVLLSAILTRTTSEQWAARRFTDHEQAFQLAEAGIDDALRVLQMSSLNWNEELVGADGIPATADDGILPFGLTVTLATGSYTVKISDNDDERAPNPNDPAVDVDGVIRIDSVGTTPWHQRAVAVSLWALFNHAIAAQVDILLRQASALGNIHANQNIEVRQTSELFGSSQATAAGSFVIPAGETLIHSSGDLIGGDPTITFFRPDETALRNAVTRWDAANWKGTIALANNDVIGYERQLGNPPNSPQTVSLPASDRATIVMFDGNSIRFRQRLGTFSAGDVCQVPVILSIIALGGGSIAFEQPVCLRGLIWAEGNITVAQESTITGAVVSAAGSIDVKQSSSITFSRTAIDASLLPGFSGSTVLIWQEL
ncbi:MAG: hypothetical protein HY353_00065 [Candidatus Omnitrophica bacterium]|nr:hypothetical protein [Candidatus Omnitrophota bacterium]